MLKGPKQYRNMRPIPRNIRFVREGEGAPAAQKPEPPPIPESPAWLANDAADIYRHKAAQIQQAGYWQPRFADALALYSQLFAHYQKDPASCSASKITQMRLLLSELGLTPQSARGVK